MEPSPSPPLPGRLAVPVSVAVSVTGCPKSTGLEPACVVRCGVFGVIVKHSLWLVASFGSLDGGTPLTESPEYAARQQYLPTFVSGTELHATVCGLETSVRVVDEIGTPPD